MEKIIRGGTSVVLVDPEKNFSIKKVTGYLMFNVFQREIDWLHKLKDFDRTPTIIEVNPDENIISTSYCGEPLNKKNLPPDWDFQIRYIYDNLKRYECCHNDIKPSDLLVKDDKIMLVDFGWATRTGDSIPPNWPAGLGLGYAYGKHRFNDLYSLMRSIFAVCLIKQKPDLCSTPNMHTELPQIDIRPEGCYISGYQKYFISDRHIAPLGGNLTNPKMKSLFNFFRNGFFRGKTFLDLGAANGFFSVCALAAEASRVTAVDIDPGHLEIIRKVKEKFGFRRLNVVQENISNYTESADIVFALALIHWIYSCTSVFGSLSSAVGYLKKLTHQYLFIEWIDPSDSAIQFFKHIDFNRDLVSGPYDKSTFMDAITSNFREIKKIADISSTRELYLCMV